MSNSAARIILTCSVAVMMVVGFTAAPAAAIGDDVSIEVDGISVEIGDDVSVDASDDGVSAETDDEEVSIGPDDLEENDFDEGELEALLEELDEDELDALLDEFDADGIDELLEELDGDATDAAFDELETDGDSDGTAEEAEPDPPFQWEEIPFPEETCTDVPEEAGDEIPFEDLPWFSDLPDEAQPPGVPTDVVTPRAVFGIVSGASPNQCDVYDPNDPPFSPTDPPRDPDSDVDIERLGERNGGPIAIVNYEATLNESGEGPGVSGVVYSGANPEFSDSGFDLVVNDGEKEYAVEPRVRHWDDGTAWGETDVTLIGSRLGVTMDCDGDECQPGTRGLPQFEDYPAFPAPTGQEDDDEDNDQTFPESVCTDVPEEAGDEIPFEDLPWFSDLPDEAQPPGVPTDVVTPRAVFGIVSGASPNQCDVQDPNDPSYNPVTGDDEVDPDADVGVNQLGERNGGPIAIVTYEATLNESGEGPGISGVVYSGANPEFSDSGFDLAVNDGEKDYAVEPRVRHWDDGTAWGETDVTLIGSRLGVTMDCDGDECQPGTRGLPQFEDYPAVPAPTESAFDIVNFVTDQADDDDDE